MSRFVRHRLPTPGVHARWQSSPHTALRTALMISPLVFAIRDLWLLKAVNYLYRHGRALEGVVHHGKGYDNNRTEIPRSHDMMSLR